MGRDEILTALANEVRRLSGATEKLGFVAMTEELKNVEIGGNTSRLPSGYTEREYIRSSGTQYIVTRFKPKYNSRIVADIEGLGTSATWVFGAKNNNKATETKQFALIRIDSSNIRADYFGGKTASLSKSDTSARTTIDMNGNVTTMFGQTLTNQAVSSGAVDYPLAIFTCNLGNDFSRSKAAIKLYSFKVYDNGVLVLDFVPCVNPSGEAGLYDIVEGEFYGNDGTGSFDTNPVSSRMATPSVSQMRFGTVEGGASTMSVNVGVTPSSSDVFMLVYSGEAKENSCDYNKCVLCAVKSGSRNVITHVSCGVIDCSGDPVGQSNIINTKTSGIAYSGQYVNIDPGISECGFADDQYTWCLISG